MNVFTEYHHGDLFYSLHLMIEKRLGWNLYRPIGTEWFYGGYWKIAEPYNNNLDTVGQYLDIRPGVWNQYTNLNSETDHYIKDNIYYFYEPLHKYYQKAITLEQFKNMKFDILMPTIKAHDYTYTTLKDQYQPKAKMVAQMGNTWQTTNLPNVLHSVAYTPNKRQNALFYHQELDLNLYKYSTPDINTKNIYSIVNCLPYPELYALYKNKLIDINMKAYGADCPDGPLLFGAKTVGEKMIEANLGWHCKPLGGMGHTFTGWLASGRFLITRFSDITSDDKESPKFLEQGITCHNLDAFYIEENCKKIYEYLDNCTELSENVYKRFCSLINYNEEEQKIRTFFGKLL